MDKNDMEKKSLLTIYLVMFRIGAITFGGGWSIMAQMEEEFCEKRNWIRKEDILDYMSMARSFPGIMIINYSLMCGYRMGGIPGGITAALGLSSPAILILSVITVCYTWLIENPLVARMMTGVRCVVIPIMIKAAWKMKAAALKEVIGYFLMAGAFLICAFTSFDKLLLVAISALIGILWWGFLKKEKSVISADQEASGK